MAGNGYIKSLDGVRAIAILLVMSFHFRITHFGWFGVQLFFVLSGFLISGILWKEKFKDNLLPNKFKKFWVRRTLRIFPLYFGFLIFLTISYLIFHFPSYFQTYIPYLATYTFNYCRTLPEWQPNPLFTHLWSLSVEEQFYLFFPLIIFLCRPRLIKSLMIVIIFIAPVIRFFLGEYYKSKGLPPEVIADTIYWNTLSHLDAFFMGGIIPVLSLHKRIKRSHILFVLSLFSVITAGLWDYTNRNTGFNYFTDLGYNHGLIGNYEHVWHYTLLNLLFATFILTVISNPGLVFSRLRIILENKWMVRIGRVSYGMYVFHWAIFVYVINRIYSTDTFLIKILLFIPYVAATYLFAALSYKFFESPFLRLKDRFFQDKVPDKKDSDKHKP